MSNIDERLDRVRELLKDPDFLEGNGLSNEVNIRMFCYEAKDEMRVRHFTSQIMADQSLPCHLIEKNLYEIFLSVCEDKRILPYMQRLSGSHPDISVRTLAVWICIKEIQSGNRP